MPGTRSGGFFSNIATSASSGVSERRVFSNNNRLPRRQVYINAITRPPSASGIQPPSKTLSRLAVRKVKSMNSSGAIRRPAARGDHFHTFQITTNAIITVTTIVPVTAMP